MTVVSHTSLSVREFRGKLRAEQHETGRKRRSRLNQRPVHLSTNSHVPSESRVKMCLEPTAKSKYSKDFNFLFLITPTPGQEEWKGTYPPWWTSRLHEGRVLPPLKSLGMAEAGEAKCWSDNRWTRGTQRTYNRPVYNQELWNCWSGVWHREVMREPSSTMQWR